MISASTQEKTMETKDDSVRFSAIFRRFESKPTVETGVMTVDRPPPPVNRLRGKKPSVTIATMTDHCDDWTEEGSMDCDQVACSSSTFDQQVDEAKLATPVTHVGQGQGQVKFKGASSKIEEGSRPVDALDQTIGSRSRAVDGLCRATGCRDGSKSEPGGTSSSGECGCGDERGHGGAGSSGAREEIYQNFDERVKVSGSDHANRSDTSHSQSRMPYSQGGRTVEASLDNPTHPGTETSSKKPKRGGEKQSTHLDSTTTRNHGLNKSRHDPDDDLSFPEPPDERILRWEGTKDHPNSDQGTGKNYETVGNEEPFRTNKEPSDSINDKSNFSHHFNGRNKEEGSFAGKGETVSKDMVSGKIVSPKAPKSDAIEKGELAGTSGGNSSDDSTENKNKVTSCKSPNKNKPNQSPNTSPSLGQRLQVQSQDRHPGGQIKAASSSTAPEFSRSSGGEFDATNNCHNSYSSDKMYTKITKKESTSHSIKSETDSENSDPIARATIMARKFKAGGHDHKEPELPSHHPTRSSPGTDHSHHEGRPDGYRASDRRNMSTNTEGTAEEAEKTKKSCVEFECQTEDGDDADASRLSDSSIRDQSTDNGGSISSYFWFFDDVDREKSEKMLSSMLDLTGSYLVRRSARGGESSQYTLSVVYRSQVYHVLIRQRSDKKFAIGKEKDVEKVFGTIPELIGFYQNNFVELIGDSMKSRAPGKVQLKHCPPK